MRLAAARWTALTLVITGCAKKPVTEAPVPITETTTTEEVAAAPATVEGRVDRAVSLLATQRRADDEQALVLLDGVLREKPDLVVAVFNRGVAQARLGEYREAIRSFEDAIELDPTLDGAWANLAEVQRRAGRMDKALLAWEDAVAARPESAVVRLGFVRALRRAGRPADAIAQAKAALEIDARSLDIYDEMGRAYLDLGDLDLAAFVFEKARATHGGEQSAPILTHYALTLARQGNKASSAFYLEKALAVDGAYVPALVALADLRMADHDWARAASLLEVAEAKMPDIAAVQSNLGVAYKGLGRYEEAERKYRRALELDPQDPTPYFNLGILYGDVLKRYDDAVAAFEAYGSGPQAALAREYIEDVEKEKRKAERRRQAEEQRRAAEARRAEEERLLREEQERERREQQPAPGGAAEPAPDGGDAGAQPTPEATSPWDAPRPEGGE